MRETNIKGKKFRYSNILLIPVLAVVFVFFIILIINKGNYPNSDFFTFWLSGRLFTLGENPYDSQVWVNGHHQFGASWIPNATFIYPMPITLLFAPLGLLPLPQAFIIWVILSLCLIFFAFVLLLKVHNNYPYNNFILPVFVGIVLFRPVFPTLLSGQISGLLLFVLAAIIYLWEMGKWRQGAILMTVLALKPNLGIPIIGLLSVYLIFSKRLASLVTSIIFGGFLIFVGLVQNPNWLIEFWNAGNTKLSQTFGISPTIWGITSYFCNYGQTCTVVYGISISLFFIIGYMYLLAKKGNILPPSVVVGIAVAITLLLTPYTWSYDQLLLVAPILAFILLLVKNGYGFLPVSLVFLGIDIFALILLWIATKVRLDIWNASVPLLILCLIIWFISNDRVKLPEVEAD